MSNSAGEKAIFESAGRGAWYLNEDFNVLIDRVYDNNAFSSDDKSTIADALDKTFKSKLEDAIGELVTIAKNMNIKLEGEAYDD